MIELPSWPGPVDVQPFLIDFGGLLEPGLGAEVQRIDRMGNRFGATFIMPPLGSEKDGRIFLSRLIRGKTEGARIDWPLLGFKPGAPGSPRVNGAGQSGRSLVVDGLTPNYTIREGQWLSLLHEGRHYLHNSDAEVTANAAGQATLSISPMLRVEPADNDEVHLARPMFEGFIGGEEMSWRIALSHDLGLEFEMRERA